MRRREFITLLGGAAVVWPRSVRAQQSIKAAKIPRIGVLWHAGSAEEEEVYLSVVRKAFDSLGYIEGKNIELVHRFPAEKPERFRALAQELVESKVDAIIAVTALGALEAKRATTTIPVVFVVVPDPVAIGLVESLCSARRQSDRSFPHGRRSKREASSAAKGGSSETVTCCTTRRFVRADRSAFYRRLPCCGCDFGTFAAARRCPNTRCH